MRIWKRRLRDLTFWLVVGAVVWFVMCGGLNMLGIRVPSISGIFGSGPNLTSGAPSASVQLTSLLSRHGVTIYADEARLGGALLTLRWTGASSKGSAALSTARKKRLIRSSQPDGANHIDIRTHGDQQVYLGRFVVNY